MTTVRRGYTFQFTRRPPCFRGVLATTVRSENAQVLRAEVMNLLEKGTIEIVPPAQSESGFYSSYILVPKKDSSLRPILDLRLLNYALMKRSFRMITLKQILLQICPGDWFMSLDLGPTHHRRFLRVAFEGVAYQYKVLLFGLYLAPRTCTDAWMRLSPLCDRWESAYSTTSTTGSFWPSHRRFNIAQDPPPQPLRLSGAQGQICQEHTVTQPTSFVPGYSYRLRWQQLSQRIKPWQFSATRPPSRKVPPIRSKLSRECWALWQRLRQYFSWVCFTCDPSSSGWSRAFHPRPGVTDATK